MQVTTVDRYLPQTRGRRLGREAAPVERPHWLDSEANFLSIRGPTGERRYSVHGQQLSHLRSITLSNTELFFLFLGVHKFCSVRRPTCISDDQISNPPR